MKYDIRHSIKVNPFKFTECDVLNASLETVKVFSALLNEFKFLKKDDKAKEFIAIHEDGASWDTFFAELKKFSQLYPNTFFRTEPCQETSHEFWRCHIRDGELQYAEYVTTYAEGNS